MISKREEIQQILFWQNFDHKAKAGPFAIVDVMTAAIRQSGLARLDKGPAQHARPLESFVHKLILLFPTFFFNLLKTNSKFQTPEIGSK
jgi:hypothetical protein